MPDYSGITEAPPSQTVIGTVSVAAAGGVATVKVFSNPVKADVARGLSPALNDVVTLVKRGVSWQIIGILYTSAPPVSAGNDIPDPDLGSGTTGTGTSTAAPVIKNSQTVFQPTSTGSYRSGIWRTDTDDAMQGVSPEDPATNTGAAFYGFGPGGLPGTTALSASLSVKREKGGSGGPQTSTLFLIQEKFQPVGAPTSLFTTTGPSLAVGEMTDFVIPTAWAQDLLDGDAGGIGIVGEPYVRLSGKNSYGGAFVLTLNWKKNF